MAYFLTRATVFTFLGYALLSFSAFAQHGPGEDPVVLEQKINIQMLPFGASPRSGYIAPPAEMPDWQRARISRYEAKSFSGDPGDILTNKDVVSTKSSNGLKTTCTQSIGSTAPQTTAAGAPREQVVVLRGDLVNICN